MADAAQLARLPTIHMFLCFFYTLARIVLYFQGAILLPSLFTGTRVHTVTQNSSAVLLTDVVLIYFSMQAFGALCALRSPWKIMVVVIQITVAAALTPVLFAMQRDFWFNVCVKILFFAWACLYPLVRWVPVIGKLLLQFSAEFKILLCVSLVMDSVQESICPSYIVRFLAIASSFLLAIPCRQKNLYWTMLFCNSGQNHHELAWNMCADYWTHFLFVQYVRYSGPEMPVIHKLQHGKRTGKVGPSTHMQSTHPMLTCFSKQVCDIMLLDDSVVFRVEWMPHQNRRGQSLEVFTDEDCMGLLHLLCYHEKHGGFEVIS